MFQFNCLNLLPYNGSYLSIYCDDIIGQILTYYYTTLYNNYINLIVFVNNC